jgi:hypothetical protein
MLRLARAVEGINSCLVGKGRVIHEPPFRRRIARRYAFMVIYEQSLQMTMEIFWCR